MNISKAFIEKDILMNYIEIAYSLISQGFSVFPCNNKKRPSTMSAEEINIPGIKGGFHTATKDYNSVVQWLEGSKNEATQYWREPSMMKYWGVPTSTQNLIIIDVDTYKIKNKETMDIVDNDLLQYKNNIVQKTLHGGVHYAFKHSGSNVYRNIQGAEDNFVDVRGDGGYICIYDPSINLRNIAEISTSMNDFLVKYNAGGSIRINGVSVNNVQPASNGDDHRQQRAPKN